MPGEFVDRVLWQCHTDCKGTRADRSTGERKRKRSFRRRHRSRESTNHRQIEQSSREAMKFKGTNISEAIQFRSLDRHCGRQKRESLRGLEPHAECSNDWESQPQSCPSPKSFSR